MLSDSSKNFISKFDKTGKKPVRFKTLFAVKHAWMQKVPQKCKKMLTKTICQHQGAKSARDIK